MVHIHDTFKKSKETVDHLSHLQRYPNNMSFNSKSMLLIASQLTCSQQEDMANNHPIWLACTALLQWNMYLSTGETAYREVFLTQARWFVVHEQRIGKTGGGWPIVYSSSILQEDVCLSALVQGLALSILARAYQLTQDRLFLEIVQRVLFTFQQDILDGGICALIGEYGVFFEATALYPARHTLYGHLFALLGLYDCVAIYDNMQIQQTIEQGSVALHTLLDEFDIGFWTYTDLRDSQLASYDCFSLQTMLLEALALSTGCEHCLALASRWSKNLDNILARCGCNLLKGGAFLTSTSLNWIRTIFFNRKRVISSTLRICVPVTAFPVAGGMRTVLEKLEEVTTDVWSFEYLTQRIGPHSERHRIHRFGTRSMSPWQFPMVWLYFLSGLQKLISLLHQGTNYDIILPQDSVYTATFAALSAKLAGIRVVCIDHGNLSLLHSKLYRAERVKALKEKHWLRRGVEQILFFLYWPSLSLLAWISARFVDHFFIPGVSGDGVEDICRHLGIGSSKLTRFANAIDIAQYKNFDATTRATLRLKRGIPPEAMLVTMVCRLAPEKGLEIAIQAMSKALSTLSMQQRSQVRIVFAGDGPLRTQLEADIHAHNLSDICILCGEVSAEGVAELLGVSDIFLFTSRRAAGYPLAILEAMASGCAIIATNQPLANEKLLAEGRGIVVAVGDVEQTSEAIRQLLSNPTHCQQMGELAREYIATKHNAEVLRRAFLRVTRWSELQTLLQVGKEYKG